MFENSMEVFRGSVDLSAASTAVLRQTKSENVRCNYSFEARRGKPRTPRARKRWKFLSGIAMIDING